MQLELQRGAEHDEENLHVPGAARRGARERHELANLRRGERAQREWRSERVDSGRPRLVLLDHGGAVHAQLRLVQCVRRELQGQDGRVVIPGLLGIA